MITTFLAVNFGPIYKVLPPMFPYLTFMKNFKNCCCFFTDFLHSLFETRLSLTNLPLYQEMSEIQVMFHSLKITAGFLSFVWFLKDFFF